MFVSTLLSLLAFPLVQSGGAPVAEASRTSDEFVAEVRAKLKAHTYFSKLVLVEKTLSPTLRLFLQVPQVAPVDWEQKLVAQRGPWLLQAEQRFLERFAQPMGLARRSDVPVSVMCLLQTAGDYLNFAERTPSQSPFRQGATFDRRNRWTVLYESGGRLSEGTRRTTQMAEVVSSLVHAHSNGGVSALDEEFFISGVAGYLCEDLGATPDTLGNCKPPPRLLAALVNALAQPESAYACILRLDELAEHASWERYWKLTEARASGLSAQLGDAVAGQSFHAQGVLWTHFLMDGHQGRDRARFLAYLRHALEGKGGGATLRGAFEGVSMDALAREFLAWAVALDAANRKSPTLPAGTLEGLFRGPPTRAASAPPAADSNPAPNAKASSGFDVERLRTPVDELDTRHGIALARAAQGHLREAISRISELAPLAKEASERDRLERERERLVALDAMRARILDERIAAGKKLQFQLPDKKLVASVRAVEGEWLLLGENRLGLERLPLSDFSLELLARELPSPAPEAWLKPYLQLLAGSGRVVKLPSEERELADLRADAQQISARLQSGLVAFEFEALAQQGVPSEVASARDAVEAVRKLLATHGQTPLVRARRAALRDYASAVLGAAMQVEQVSELFGGRCELLPDGQVTWTLQFDDEAEAGVFTPIPDGWQNLREYICFGRASIEPKLEFKSGGLAVRGSGAWVSPAAFREVSTARVRGKHVWDPNVRDDEFVFYVLLGYREPQRYLAFSASASMVSFDADSNAHAKSHRTTPLYANVPYECTLTRAEGKVRVRCGDYTSEMDDVVPSAGRVALFSLYRGHFLLDSLSVTGTPDLEALRPSYVQRELDKLGL